MLQYLLSARVKCVNLMISVMKTTKWKVYKGIVYNYQHFTLKSIKTFPEHSPFRIVYIGDENYGYWALMVRKTLIIIIGPSYVFLNVLLAKLIQKSY
jgi:hypothetical protein